jgi:hypothetical protein
MYKKGVFVNMTCHQQHMLQNQGWLLMASQYISCIGVSSADFDDKDMLSLIEHLERNGVQIIIHAINGVDTVKDFMKNRRVLILGFKNKGRGEETKFKNTLDLKWLKDNAKVLGFDELGLEQLKPFEVLEINEEDYERLHMGKDGQFTYYVDLVEMTYSVNSLQEKKFNINDWTAKGCFKNIRELIS